jgi:hypothetical protein
MTYLIIRLIHLYFLQFYVINDDERSYTDVTSKSHIMLNKKSQPVRAGIGKNITAYILVKLPLTHIYSKKSRNMQDISI